MEIKLASHEHSMHYYCFHETDDKQCHKCREEICGAAYACLRCQLWLHESCAKALEHLPREITHPLHSQHHLMLDWSGVFTREFICDICLKISSGTNYTCSRCNFELDLVCAFSTNDDQQAMKKERSSADRDKQIIQHYCHRDPLVLYKHSSKEEHDYNCSWCDKPLTGIFYGCKGCRFFLHEFCTNKIPKTLNHPFHPSHPLRLHFVDSNTNCNACTQLIRQRTASTYSYCCQECNFNLDFDCAKLFPTLKHECHDHYLTYFGLNNFKDKIIKYYLECNTCHELCLDSLYRCVQCDLNLHLKCVPIPPSAEHRYHIHLLVLENSIKEDDFGEYYCDICEKERDPTHEVYYCRKCTYIAHIQCVLNEDETSAGKVSSSAPESMDSEAFVEKEMEQFETIYDDLQQTLVRPLIHEHLLKFCEATEKFEPQYCTACRLILSGPGYICEECPLYIQGYYLHEKCSQLPNEIQHPLHSHHVLNLYTRHPSMGDFIICDECGDFFLGFFYLCEECDFELDLKCAMQAGPKRGLSTLKEAERETELFHFSHRHKLVFGNFKDPTYERQCNFCRLQIFGPTYYCFLCGWILHESCLRLPQVMQVPLHPQHMSILSYTRYGCCLACALKLLSAGYSYICEECHLSFHIACADSLRRPLKRKSHMHDLYYFGTEFHRFFAMYSTSIDFYAAYFCSHCGEVCSGQPFYRCLECYINFHIECVPIPQIVKSKSHIHPFTLKDSFIEDDLGEYYCDVCEKERHLSDGIYYCEECQGLFVAHIECVLLEEEEVLSYLVPRESERERKKRTRKAYLARRRQISNLQKAIDHEE
ncbi:PREDICTED: uncharacterized protein LOC18600045 isoform X1 [Theobroma cacao]|uniref:Uncharacterized protein LOC18600045 isoform X1 n=1 Tax=Theobroma cacao TaxID=3641 RepID=A0AB32V613_THECC|nr:PREDICTED: uncharacterized protein LOC18600045 isoform X1 [Theobroma cacao]